MKVEYLERIGVYVGTAKIGGRYYYSSGYTHFGVITRLLTIARHI